jgi:hypothetical protein
MVGTAEHGQCWVVQPSQSTSQPPSYSLYQPPASILTHTHTHTTLGQFYVNEEFLFLLHHSLTSLNSSKGFPWLGSSNRKESRSLAAVWASCAVSAHLLYSALPGGCPPQLILVPYILMLSAIICLLININSTHQHIKQRFKDSIDIINSLN